MPCYVICERYCIYLSVRNAVCMMLVVDMSKGTCFSGRVGKRNVNEQFLYVYFRNKHLATAFQVVRVFPNIIWFSCQIRAVFGSAVVLTFRTVKRYLAARDHHHHLQITVTIYRPPSQSADHRYNLQTTVIIYRPPSSSTDHRHNLQITVTICRSPSKSTDHRHNLQITVIIYRPPSQSAYCDGGL